MGNAESKRGTTSSASNRIVSTLRPGPSSSKVNSHLENAKKSRILQLKNSNIKEIPNAIDEVANILRSLDLSENKIVQFPSKISTYQNLKQLHLQKNHLTVVPDEIGCLTNLEHLDVSFNKLSEIPSSISTCSSLKTLNASNNAISLFPIGICNASAIESVDLSNNQIKIIPDEIGRLNAIELNLDRNQLSKLNDKLADCRNLRVLRVEENCLDKNEFTEKILGSSSISLIKYYGNLFQEKDFQQLPGYESYQERFTATKRKGV